MFVAAYTTAATASASARFDWSTTHDSMWPTRPRRAVDPEALLQLAANVLRARPPEGLDASDIDAFLLRNRPALIRQISLAFGGAAA